MLTQIYSSLDRLDDMISNKVNEKDLLGFYDESSNLTSALDELDVIMLTCGRLFLIHPFSFKRQVFNINSTDFNEGKIRVKMETQLEDIIRAAALLADSNSTRSNRRDKIVEECNTLRLALQDLLNVYAHKV